MADNKKSIVIYCDLIHTVESMEDDEAGKLFKHLLRYVNDLNPSIPDKLTQIAFEPIKQQLKRDLIKYESKKKQWSEAGKASAEKRSTKINDRSTTVKKRSTVSTVSVNDNVNVSDNVSVINNKIPSENEFLEHCKIILQHKYQEYEFSLKSKYQTWIDDGWKTGHGKKINNWKNTINNTIPHLKPITNGQSNSIDKATKSTIATNQLRHLNNNGFFQET